MTVPDDIDEAYEMFDDKVAALNAAIRATEVEQSEGRTGHRAYLHAQQLEDELKEFSRKLSARIDEALRTL